MWLTYHVLSADNIRDFPLESEQIFSFIHSPIKENITLSDIFNVINQNKTVFPIHYTHRYLAFYFHHHRDVRNLEGHYASVTMS